MLLSFLLALPLLTSASSHPRHGGHSHSASKRLPTAWYHADDHPVNSLFKRAGATDGASYPAIGTPEWSKPFPPGPPAKADVNTMPAEWKAALDAAVARKAIPDIPIAKDNGDDNPTYPDGSDPNSPEICSATYGCRIKTDVWDAVSGSLGISFDDGPLPPTNALIAFLETQKQTVTHFMIGSNILENSKEFVKAFEHGDDIAVHTWTHPHMTTRSNLEVVAELGWTMEAIHISTGGRVPKYWRPPYGDSDVRTSAIAREVFGLTTVIWNQDTNDWMLEYGDNSLAKINASMTEWLTGPKNPGLVILEHESSDASVQSFMAAYPVMKANNWNTVSLATLLGEGAAYQNAADNVGPVNKVTVVDAKDGKAPAAAAAASGSASASGGARASNSQKVAAASGSVAAPTPSNSASSRWTTQGSVVGLFVIASFMLWS
ncbi:carbohydrate esterase family 4 protein [Mycena crocata]|nr:carbohydrate esterase family 4 protein [Mycena crocata]